MPPKRLNPSKRQEKLLEYLKQQNDWVTVEEIADLFKVSSRTIYNDLDQLDKTVSIIERKPGIGVRVIEGANKSEELEKEFDRSVYILKELLIMGETVSYEGLSQRYFVSVNSIKNDIKKIKNWLSSETSLELVSNPKTATYIKGSEYEIREAMIKFNNHLLSDGHVDNESRRSFYCEFYSDEVTDLAYKSFYKFIKENDTKLIAEHHVTNMLNVYLVTIYRIKNGHLMSPDKTYVLDEHHYSIDYTTTAQNLLEVALDLYELTYSNGDVDYISMYLYSCRFDEFDPAPLIRDQTEKIIGKISQSLGVSRSGNEDLFTQLEKHIWSMLYRLQEGVQTENPFVSEVKREYAQTFNSIWMVLSNLDLGGVDFNESEVAYLTIYFQAMLEKKDKLSPKKILIICQHGIATSQLLKNRLQQRLPASYKIETASLASIDEYNLEDWDLVISTSDELNGDGVVYISPFPSESEYTMIEESLQDEEESKISEIASYLLNFLNSDFIVIADYETKEDLIESVCHKLEETGYVSQGYMGEVIKREEVSGTDMPKGIAVPHAPAEYVKETVVCLVNLKSPVLWSDYFVDTVIFIAISPSDQGQASQIVKAIYKLINSQQFNQNREKVIEDLSQLTKIRGDKRNERNRKSN